MLLSNLDLLATALGGVAKLRELILTLAVQGKLVPQDPTDEPASVLLQKIRAETYRLIAEDTIKKNKPLKDITEEEKPFDLPNNWVWIRLGLTMEMLNGRAFKSSDWIGEGLPIVRIQNLNNPNASFNYCDSSCVAKKNLIDDGDFLISWSGTPGTSFGAFIWNRGAAALNQHIFKCVLIGGAFLPEFLRLSINSQLNVLIAKAQGGVGLQHITKGVLENLVLALPSLAEQSRIVARVQELMQLCDALESKGQLEATQHAQLLSTLLGTLTASATPEELTDNWKRVAQHFDLLLDRPEAIDALEQTILQLAVRGLLVPQDPADEPAGMLLQKIRTEKDRLIAAGQIKRDKPMPPIMDEEKPFELPVGWEWVRLGEIVHISSGVTLGRKTTIPSPVSLPYLRVANVQRWHLNLSSMKEVVIDNSELDRFQLLNGDLLITEGGDWDKVGRTAIWRDELQKCLHQNHVFKARGISSDWNPVWAELYLNSAAARAYFGSSAKQTTNLASINMTQLKACAIPMPTLSEQSRIITRMAEMRRLCVDLRQRLAEHQSVQARLAEALVQTAA